MIRFGFDDRGRLMPFYDTDDKGGGNPPPPEEKPEEDITGGIDRQPDGTQDDEEIQNSKDYAAALKLRDETLKQLMELFRASSEGTKKEQAALMAEITALRGEVAATDKRLREYVSTLTPQEKKEIELPPPPVPEVKKLGKYASRHAGGKG